MLSYHRNDEMTLLLLHHDSLVPAVYTEWDGVMTMNQRFWHACPLCGIGVCSPYETPMAHRECMASYVERLDV